ncbi:acylphosphatase [Lachnospiraceae bacterium TWA4]|nr:acylphosphatase [Lachnospiraceae bacterium TWA4]
MSMEDLFKRIQNRLLSRVDSDGLPLFPKGEILREQIIFEGQVQMVGFRYEVQYTAQKLGLTGMAMNRTDGSVLVELQGTIEKIDYCLDYINRVKRFTITKMRRTKIPVINDERSFITGDL